ncbi:MAG: tetratricopeptide repeat protein [Saprospiraceae bacterium]
MKLFVFIISLLFPISILANNVDSLTNRLDLVENEEKVDLLNQLLEEVSKSNPNLAFEYGRKALDLAKKIIYKKGIADSSTNLGNLYFKKGAFSRSDSLVILAMNIYDRLNDEEGQAKCHMILGNNLYRNNNPSKSIFHFDQSRKIYEKLDSPSQLASLYINYGNAYWYKNQIDTAQIYYEKSLDLAIQNGLKSHQSVALSNLAIVSNDLGDLVQSIKYDLRAIALAKSEKNYERLANIRYNLGITLKDLKLYSEGLNFIQDAKIYYDSTDNRRSIALCLGGIADILGKQGDHNKSLDFYKRKYAIYKELGINKLGHNLGNIGNAYRKLGVPDSARWYLEKSHSYKKSSNNKRSIAFYHLQSGLLDLMEKDTLSAKENFLTSIKLMSEMKFLLEKNDLAAQLSKIYLNQKDFEQAAYYQNMTAELTDSLFNIEKASESNRLLIKEEINYFK